MSHRQLTIAVLFVGLVTLMLIVELSEHHVTTEDLKVAAAFVTGSGFVFAFYKAGSDD